MKCPNCGTELNNNETFCTSCGTRVDGTSQIQKSGEKGKGLAISGIIISIVGVVIVIIGYSLGLYNK